MNEVRILCKSQRDAWRAASAITQAPIQEGEEWLVTMQPYTVKRSELQNRYLWGWLYRNIEKQLEDGGIHIPLDDGSEYPYTKDILHDIFKEMFLCYGEIARTSPKTGERKVRKLCYSTTQLVKHAKTEEQEQRCFSVYVTKIKQFAFQVWGIHIPPTYNEELLELEAEVNARRAA